MKKTGSYSGKLTNEKGATAVEYAIMVATIAIVIIATVAVIGLKVGTIFQSLIGRF
jgi:Flp pilus assembly pilin Flp